MNLRDQSNWKDQVLGEILRAVAGNPELKQALIFKGARILNIHLGSHRQSLDIDSSMDASFHEDMPGLKEEGEWFREHLQETLHRYFEDQEPVRYTLDAVRVRRNPPAIPHPRGWDMLVADIKVTDQLLRELRSLPQLQLEIAAPESLGPAAVCELRVDGSTVRAYALHRIAGEKLRAYLTSLPAYRAKMGSVRTARVKDLHDLARILAARPLSDTAFWKQAAGEFRLACESRYVDCAGPETFHQTWDAVQTAYTLDGTLHLIPWAEAEHALSQILECFSALDVFPLSFPLPA